MNQITTSIFRQSPAQLAATLEADLRHRDGDEVVRIVAGMMLAFRDGGNASAGVSAAYRAVLSDLPVAAVARAAERFARGQVEGRNHAFPPSAAEMHTEAARIEADMRRMVRVFSPPKPVALPEPEISPEERARVAAKIDELAAELRVSAEVESDKRRRLRSEDAKRERERWEAKRVAECRHYGVDPLMGISVALARQFGVAPEHPEDAA